MWRYSYTTFLTYYHSTPPCFPFNLHIILHGNISYLHCVNSINIKFCCLHELCIVQDRWMSISFASYIKALKCSQWCKDLVVNSDHRTTSSFVWMYLALDLAAFSQLNFNTQTNLELCIKWAWGINIWRWIWMWLKWVWFLVMMEKLVYSRNTCFRLSGRIKRCFSQASHGKNKLGCNLQNWGYLHLLAVSRSLGNSCCAAVRCMLTWRATQSSKEIGWDEITRVRVH